MRPSKRMLQLALAAWAVVWIGLAAATAYELYVLHGLGDTLVKTGVAVDTSGKALQALAGVPFVGGRVGTLAGQVRAAGQSAVASGHASSGSAVDLAVLIGIAIALIPTVPVVVLSLMLRSTTRRERDVVARALRERPDDTLLEEYLARRAVTTLPYAQLREVTAQPWADLDAGRFGALADAELARLGLRPHRWRR